MTYDIPHTVDSGRAEPIAFMRTKMMPAVTRALADTQQVRAGWYGNFVEDERALDERRDADPAAPDTEGWMTYPHHPRFGSNYRGLTNRLDLLLECYSYLTFEERVSTTYATILEALDLHRRARGRRRAGGRREPRTARAHRRALQARAVRRADRDRHAHAAHARRRAVVGRRPLLR
jgi:hypothetical protein